MDTSSGTGYRWFFRSVDLPILLSILTFINCREALIVAQKHYPGIKVNICTPLMDDERPLPRVVLVHVNRRIISDELML